VLSSIARAGRRSSIACAARRSSIALAGRRSSIALAARHWPVLRAALPDLGSAPRRGAAPWAMPVSAASDPTPRGPRA
jgi:hypothetical protein